jgi:hypothetical protein
VLATIEPRAEGSEMRQHPRRLGFTCFGLGAITLNFSRRG